MEQAQFLIDTNSVIDYLGQNLPDEGMEMMNKIIDLAFRDSIIIVLDFK